MEWETINRGEPRTVALKGALPLAQWVVYCSTGCVGQKALTGISFSSDVPITENIFMHYITEIHQHKRPSHLHAEQCTRAVYLGGEGV